MSLIEQLLILGAFLLTIPLTALVMMGFFWVIDRMGLLDE